MKYCNNNKCSKIHKCKTHIGNIDIPGLYNIQKYDTGNCKMYNPIICPICNRSDREIYANGICKACYYRGKTNKTKKAKKKKGITAEEQKRINIITEIRTEGATYKKIGDFLGLTKQRVQQIYKTHNSGKKY